MGLINIFLLKNFEKRIINIIKTNKYFLKMSKKQFANPIAIPNQNVYPYISIILILFFLIRRLLNISSI